MSPTVITMYNPLLLMLHIRVAIRNVVGLFSRLENSIVGFDVQIYFSMCRRLHPAMYLLALAYRTLDIEDSRRSKQRMKDLVESNVSRILSWCKRLVHWNIMTFSLYDHILAQPQNLIGNCILVVLWWYRWPHLLKNPHISLHRLLIWMACGLMSRTPWALNTT